jgi:hypothetical protein
MRWIIALIGLLMALPAAGQGLTLTGVGTVAAGAGGGPVFATWDAAASKAGNWDFTLGNTKATCKTAYCGTGNQAVVTSTNPVTPTTETRKLYWEITPNFTGTPASNGVGMISAERYAAASDPNGPGGVVWAANGNVVADGGSPVVLGTYTTGTILSFAYDFSTKNLWLRPGCAGLWNNNAGANPATATGGGSLSGFWTTPTTAFIFGWDGFNGNADGFTLNTGASGFACAVPSGFVRWQ